MGIGVKCPKCGLTQMPGPNCKSCSAPLGKTVSRPSLRNDPGGIGRPGSATPGPGGLAAEFPEVRGIQRLEKYDLASIFPERDGYFARKAIRKKIGLLTRLSPLLARILGEQERVLFIGRGIIQYLAEIFFGNGWLTYYYNIHALVFTDQRILLINIKNNGQPKHMLHQIRYGAIQRWKGPSLIGGVVIKFNAGKKLTLVHVPRRDGGVMKNVVERMQGTPTVGSLPTAGESFQHLCPSCFAEIPKDIYACPGCRTAFKTPRKAALRSFLLPGWGDIYLTHRLLGTLELLGSAALVILLVITLLWGELGDSMVFLILLLVYHALDAALTYHMGKKGLIPEG